MYYKHGIHSCIQTVSLRINNIIINMNQCGRRGFNTTLDCVCTIKKNPTLHKLLNFAKASFIGTHSLKETNVVKCLG